jgi:hypothetical protein
MLSSSKIHLVISTDTSCYHHLVSSTYTSSCYETIVWVRQRHRHAITNEMSTKARPFTRIARTPLSHDLHARTTFNTTDAMLFFYGNIVMLSSSCDLSDRHMLWIRQAHRHAIIMLSSMIHHLVSSTDTSPCYHECNARTFHTTYAIIAMRCSSSTDKIVMLSSSCDFDIHIILWSCYQWRLSSCYHHLVSSTETSSCYYQWDVDQCYAPQTKILEWWTPKSSFGEHKLKLGNIQCLKWRFVVHSLDE